MSHSILMLVIGFAAGCGAMAVVWAAIKSKRKKADALQAAQRDDTLLHINGILADTDAVEAAFRSGMLSPENFKRQLGDKINVLMRALRTNMHVLDVFYVKFVEQQAHEYLRVLERPERRKTGLVSAVPAAGPAEVGRSAERAVTQLSFPAVSDPSVGAPPPAFVPDTRTQPAALPVFGAEEAAEEAADDTFTPPAEAPAPAAREHWAPSDGDEFDVAAPEPFDEEARPDEHAEPDFDAGPAVEPITEDLQPADEAPDFDYGAESLTAPAPDSGGESAPRFEVLESVELVVEAPAANDAWDAIEEFEAAFEQFEVQTPPPAAVEARDNEERVETGSFAMSDMADDSFEPQAHEKEEEVSTETGFIDRTAISAALAQTPLPHPEAPHAQVSIPIPPPPQHISVPEPEPETPPPAPVSMPIPPPPQHISVPAPEAPHHAPVSTPIPPPPQHISVPAPEAPHHAPVSMPVPPPPQHISVPEPEAQHAPMSVHVAPPPPPQHIFDPALPPAQPQDSDGDMITGDDVGDALDALFGGK